MTGTLCVDWIIHISMGSFSLIMGSGNTPGNWGACYINLNAQKFPLIYPCNVLNLIYAGTYLICT